MARAGLLIASILAFGLAACGGNDAEPAPAADNVGAANAVSQAGDTIPQRFAGTWDTSADACTRPDSEMRLVVSRDRLKFYAGTARVRLVTRADGELVVAATLDSEGMTEERQYRLSLSDDGKLRVVADAARTIRVRC
ncbi:hypothetical protein [Stakelama marina]|uniref:Lipoprotein n=1 Tax=Stakelama marina TaxID=2826939 RepID=A0A8T4IGJ3_9SPHN|nr:hypothetical protein [Stakelama marina]MBR0552185.1 hypothetical protein [Stakelama marina]